MSNFIDEMNAIYDKEKNEKILMEQESKNREYQKLEEIKDLIFNKFVQRFKDTIVKYNYCYIEENGQKHFKGKMSIRDYDFGVSDDRNGLYIQMLIYKIKEKNTLFGKKYKFDFDKKYRLGCSLDPIGAVYLCSSSNWRKIKDKLYVQYLDNFSFYTGDGKKLCDILQKEIPSIVFEKKNRNSTGRVIGFDIYI